MTSPNNTPEWNTLEDQEKFLNLKKAEQDDLIERKHNIANILNGPKTIEIAGYKILGMPLESMGFTPEQQKKFEEAGGLMNPSVEVATAAENKDKMMYWAESFETLQVAISGTLYEGFDLFKKVYEAFPDIWSMTKEEATEAGLYPIIHYRNFAARKWMAEMNGGHLANYKGELRDIYNAAEGKTNPEKLAAMGQALLGWRNAHDATIYCLGLWAELGSGSLYGYDDVRALLVRRHVVGTNAGGHFNWQRNAFSSVVVLDK